MAKDPDPGKMQDLFAFKHSLLERARAEGEPDELELLKKRFDALWALLRNRLSLSDADLEAELAKQEQALQEALAAESKDEPKNCPKCGRALSLKTRTCFYCGGDEKQVAEALKRFGGKG